MYPSHSNVIATGGILRLLHVFVCPHKARSTTHTSATRCSEKSWAREWCCALALLLVLFPCLDSRRLMSLGLASGGKAQQGRVEVLGEGPQPSSTRIKKVFPFVWYFGPPRPGPWIDPRAWAQGRAWKGVSGPRARSRRIRRRERESQSKREGERDPSF